MPHGAILPPLIMLLLAYLYYFPILFSFSFFSSRNTCQVHGCMYVAKFCKGSDQLLLHASKNDILISFRSFKYK